MNPTNSPTSPRVLTVPEVGAFARLVRESRKWSQEQLAAISGLSVRTVQRVERGESANFDTRRALARAFELQDLDALNKPFSIPSEAELKAAKEAFDRDNVTLALAPISTGRQFAKLVEGCEMDVSEPAFELPREAAEAFAALVDYFRDYRDCSELYSETQKLEVHEDLERHMDELRSLGISLRYAERKLRIKFGPPAPDAKPMEVTALYVVAFQLGKEPDHIATPKATRIGW